MDGLNLGVRNRNRNLADAQQLDNSWNTKRWQPVVRIQPAENISGKKRPLDYFCPVRPPAIHLIPRYILLKAALAQMEAGQALEIRLHANGKPRKSRFAYTTIGFKIRSLDIHEVSPRVSWRTRSGQR